MILEDREAAGSRARPGQLCTAKPAPAGSEVHDTTDRGGVTLSFGASAGLKFLNERAGRPAVTRP